MKTKVTIADVASKANVSLMTVSRVINGANTVSVYTKQKVMDAMDALGYKPNVAARQLSSGKRGLIGVFCFASTSSFVSQFLYGCIKNTTSLGAYITVEEFNTDCSLKDQLTSFSERVEGMIILPPMSDTDALEDCITHLEVPVALIGTSKDLSRSKPDCLSIHINDVAASEACVSYLIEQGHTAIGMITGDRSQSVSNARVQGYKQALEKHRLTVDEDAIQNGDFTYRSALTAAEKLITQDNKPTAIFASNDDMAAAVIATAAKHELRVPQDLSILGFDDVNTATLVWPQLTTVRQPLHDMAEIALKFVTAGETGGVKTLPFQVIHRDSVGPGPKR